jgi:hypothetical protein
MAKPSSPQPAIVQVLPLIRVAGIVLPHRLKRTDNGSESLTMPRRVIASSAAMPPLGDDLRVTYHRASAKQVNCVLSNDAMRRGLSIPGLKAQAFRLFGKSQQKRAAAASACSRPKAVGTT